MKETKEKEKMNKLKVIGMYERREEIVIWERKKGRKIKTGANVAENSTKQKRKLENENQIKRRREIKLDEAESTKAGGKNEKYKLN